MEGFTNSLFVPDSEQDTKNLANGDHAPHSFDSHIYSNSLSDSRHQRSLRHYLTREALPKESHYRDLDSLVIGGSVRPSMDDLHSNHNTYRGDGKNANSGEETEVKIKGLVKLGWIKGVFVSCLLNIWSVMLFLRLPWIVGEAGIIQGILIITLANAVTFITTLSMSAAATNGQIKGGGVYFMISRSLGPQFGGSIGLMFTIAISIATAVHAIGFVNAVQGMMADYFQIDEIIPGSGGGVNDVRILGVITVLIMLIPAIFGIDWVMRVQVLLLVLLLAAQVNFAIGAFMGPTNAVEAARGFVGPSSYIFRENLKAEYRNFGGEQSFFSVFAVFFPAVTGIVAGANISGDLKDPSSAIPKGTLAAVVTTYTSYIVYALIIGGTVVRHAYGNATVYLEYQNASSDNPYDNPTFTEEFCPFDLKGQSICDFGSENDFKVMEIAAGWGPLIYIGCFAASLSSVIACLVGAPRIFQALAKDKLYPLIHFFAKGYGPNSNPLRGYGLTCIVTLCCVMIGDLNAVSTIVTNFYLASYCLINFSCYHASLVKSPGWRPSFKFYDYRVSMIGGIMCLAVMFLIDWVTSFCTLVVSAFLFIYVTYRKPDVNWGSSTQAQTYVSALKSSLELVYVEDHVKNFRPQILLLTGDPGTRPSLVDFAYYLTKNVSFLTCANVVKELNPKLLNSMNKQAYLWMAKHNIKAFYSAVEADDLEIGSSYLYQLCGLGKLRPNMVSLGYKSNWKTSDRKKLKSYFNTLHKAFDMHLGVIILRVPEGFDYSKVLDLAEFSLPTSQSKENMASIQGNENIPTIIVDHAPLGVRTSNPEKENALFKPKVNPASLYKGAGGVEISKKDLDNIIRFRVKQKKGTIDVWWLYDDGGLTLLLPYILTTRSQWSNCKLRVFALANRQDKLESEQRSMANLLGKFRIDFKDLIILHDVIKKPNETQKNAFDKLIQDFRATTGDGDAEGDKIELEISDEELLRNEEKTNRHIRLRELLIENSRDASLVVMTLPMPRRNSVSAPLYMAWLEALTKDMPPFMLVRGNQTSVLTFYS